MTVQTEYECEVKEVFSGDDLVALVNLEVENLWQKRRIRLSGVDTPNAIKAAPDSEAGKIRSEVRLMTRSKKATIQVVSRNQNSWVVVLLVETPSGPKNINEYLIERGYAYKRGGSNELSQA